MFNSVQQVTIIAMFLLGFVCTAKMHHIIPRSLVIEVYINFILVLVGYHEL